MQFDHHPRTRLVFGAGSIGRIGELVAEWSARHVLIVTDEHIVDVGHAPRVHRLLEDAGCRVIRFDKVRENPTTEDVDACLQAAQRSDIDTILGLGGGSSMDTAKACNFLLTNGGRMKDYWGVGKATKPMLPLVAIPTTAGTGSECQSFTLIADSQTHQKMACGDPKASARLALLDPLLTLTQPRIVTADTGIDALAHAVETAVTTRRSPFSKMYSREAFRLINANFPRVLSTPDDIDARGNMLLAAAFAGIAIEASMLGAAHAAANPLTAHHGVVHGQAVGLMLAPVVQFNAANDQPKVGYAELAVAAGLIADDANGDDAVLALRSRIQELHHAAGLPASLNALGVVESAIPQLAEEAANQWTAQFNPRAIKAADFSRLYQQVF